MKIFFIMILLSCIFACSRYSPDTETLKAYVQAEAEYLKGNLSGAESEFRKLIKKNPDFYQAHFMLGKTLFLRDNMEEAVSVFKRLAVKNPAFREAEFWLIRTDILTNNIEDAEKRLKRLSKFDSNDSRLSFLMAQMYQAKNDLKNAIDFYRKAILYEEDLARAHLELGRIYQQFGMEDKAMEELTKCLCLLTDESLLKKPVINLINNIQKAGKTE